MLSSRALLRLLTCMVACLVVACGASDNAPKPPARMLLASQAASTDVIVFNGLRAGFTITKTAQGLAVAEKLGGGSPVVVPAGARLRFADTSVAFDVDGKGGQVYRLYQAAFNRQPDPAGLGYWMLQMDGGLSLTAMAAQFVASAEFQALVGAKPSNVELVATFYNNVLHRAGERGGVDYWTGILDRDNGALPGVLAGFSESPENKALVDPTIADGFAYREYQQAYSSPTATQLFNPPPGPVVAPAPVMTLAELVGRYRRLPVENGAHTGSIDFVPGSTTLLQWSNQFGWLLRLTPDLANQRLLTDASNPYQTSGPPNFTLTYQNGKFVGFTFLNELYQRDGVPQDTVTYAQGGWRGYINYTLDRAPPAYGAGVSLYTAIWPLTDKPVDGFQVGTGTWILPNNLDFKLPLLPPDNPFRTSDPERGPTWWSVYQTIEGGYGYWLSSQFPTTAPKFKINGTGDGYVHEVSTPGWDFQYTAGTPNSLARDQMGIAQLSNRLLVPPDGITFRAGTAGEFLGYAWMALPLTSAKPDLAVPIGDQSWTLFFNASNFTGPVAFYVPDMFTKLARSYPTDIGTGLDVRPAIALGAAMEFGLLPTYAGADANGVLYSRIPRILFPTDSKGVSYLLADWHLYSAAALYDPVKDWLAGGAAASGKFDGAASFSPTIRASTLSFTQNNAAGSVAVTGLDQYVTTAIVATPGGGSAMGLQWSGKGSAGAFPDYFRKTAAGMQAVSAADVPAATNLASHEFPFTPRGGVFSSPTTGDDSWLTPAPAGAPQTALLSDGTIVTYAWYRFIDQPSLQRFGWSLAEKQRLQAAVEKIHAGWRGNREFMPPPTVGDLAALDAALIVTPPPGMEVGYVPVVTRQQRR